MLFGAGVIGSVVGIALGWFWISSAYSNQHNGTNADFSDVGGLGWNFGVVPVIVVGALYHLMVLFFGVMGYRAWGVVWTLVVVADSVVAYSCQIIPGAMATGGPESYVP
ncbi:hypothetical protein GCM10009793_34260 [Brachybacterium phenoliresistens]